MKNNFLNNNMNERRNCIFNVVSFVLSKNNCFKSFDPFKLLYKKRIYIVLSLSTRSINCLRCFTCTTSITNQNNACYDPFNSVYALNNYLLLTSTCSGCCMVIIRNFFC